MIFANRVRISSFGSGEEGEGQISRRAGLDYVTKPLISQNFRKWIFFFSNGSSRLKIVLKCVKFNSGVPYY